MIQINNFISLMESLAITSRAINQDKFLERENKRKYIQHVRQVGSISGQKAHPLLQKVKESDQMIKTLYRSKTSAKEFKMQQTKTQRKRENKILLQKIWKINSNIKFQETNHVTLQHVSGSNWNYKKRQADEIKEQNKRIASNLMNKKADAKEYKKKMEQEIKEYLNLKNQIRKCKYSPKKQPVRSKSQRKNFNLKLKDQPTVQDEVQNSSRKQPGNQTIPQAKQQQFEILYKEQELTEKIQAFEKQLNNQEQFNEKKAPQTSR